MLRTVTAIRYVTPLREGGSMPALVEADDDGLYVVKLRGAGQGPPVLVAELIAAELARVAGLMVPDVVGVEVDQALGRNEPDSEVRGLLMASGGLNLGLDFLPGSVTYDPAADPAPDALLASTLVLFDAFVTNPDRTPKNPNLLTWQRRLWLIDHGAALYFQYAWNAEAPLAGARTAFARIKDHVLLPLASRLGDAAKALQSAWTAEKIAAITVDIPDSWLVSDHAVLPTREQYAAWLQTRLEALPHIAEEAARVRASLV
ncbi:MAG: HipA family kinase [Myxococcota bacterium]